MKDVHLKEEITIIEKLYVVSTKIRLSYLVVVRRKLNARKRSATTVLQRSRGNSRAPSPPLDTSIITAEPFLHHQIELHLQCYRPVLWIRMRSLYLITRGTEGRQSDGFLLVPLWEVGGGGSGSVADPINLIRIQHFRLNTVSGSGSRALMTKN